MSTLDELITTTSVRYRAALLRHAGTLAVLGAACCAALAWRLSTLPNVPQWVAGVPILLGVLGAGALGWWMHRAWMPRRRVVAFLDEQLGLQQRLITASEFAEAPSQPLLYPLLLEDAMQRCATQQAQVPRRTQAVSAALAAALALLLLWPLGGRSLVQLATEHRSSRQTPPEPSADQDASSDRASQQELSAPGGGEGEPLSGGGGPSASQPSDGGSGQSGGQPQAAPGDTRQGQQGQQGQQGRGGEQARADGEKLSEASQGQQAADRSGQSQSEASTRPGEAGKSTAKQANASGEGQQQQQAAAESQPRQGESEESGGSSDRTGTREARDASQQGGGGQGRAGLGNQQELKADIQRLLKEVSGELKQLQQALAEANSEPPPRPGMDTDPNLYDAPEPLDDQAGAPLPIQLNTDRAPASAKRPGAGSGQPGEEIARDAPTAQRELAELSAQPTEETPMSRESIPPDYREVLDQLRQRTPPSNETRP